MFARVPLRSDPAAQKRGSKAVAGRTDGDRTAVYIISAAARPLQVKSSRRDSNVRKEATRTHACFLHAVVLLRSGGLRGRCAGRLRIRAYHVVRAVRHAGRAPRDPRRGRQAQRRRGRHRHRRRPVRPDHAGGRHADRRKLRLHLVWQPQRCDPDRIPLPRGEQRAQSHGGRAQDRQVQLGGAARQGSRLRRGRSSPERQVRLR